ncbi:gliding motility-associated C-terminal domain-containing protein [Flavobacteriaceae bacterium]|nr:gliding motility-associated C-terminal domain-containing protein [Flavobacteriaceae bacterium]
MKIYPQLLRVCLVFFFIGLAASFAQITPPSTPDISISYCSLPSSEISLQTIVFEENNVTDFVIGTSNNFTLSLPVPFSLSGDPVATDFGDDISNLKATLIDSQTVQISFDVLSSDSLDKFTISGLFVSTNTSGATGELTYNASSNPILGIENDYSIFSITSDEMPLNSDIGEISESQQVCLNSPLAPITVSNISLDFASFQWEVSEDNINFSLIEGQTGVSFTPTSQTSGVKYYRRKTTISKNGVSCSAYTNSISITVIDLTPGEINGSQSICYGETPESFTSIVDAYAMGENVSYAWERSTDDQVTWQAFENNSTTYAPGALTQTIYYRRVATSSTCDVPKKSNIITVQVFGEVLGGEGEGNQELCLNDTSAVPLSVNGATNFGGEITYQWQFSQFNNPETFVNASGEGRNKSEAEFTPDTSVPGTTFFRRITTVTNNGVSCSAISTPIKVSVIELNGGIISSSQDICIGKTPSAINVSGSSINENISYQWYSSTDNNNFTKIDGSLGESHIPSLSEVGTYYFKRELIFSGSNGNCSVFSDVTTINVVSVTTGLFDVVLESINNPLCYGPEGGSAIIRVIGGSAPYFYSIDNQESVSFGQAGSSQTTFTIQNIKPGGHSITITDSNSCSVEELSVSISMPNLISISHFQQNQVEPVGCNTPGSLSVSVTGGTPPYFYSWSGPEGYNSTSTTPTINDILQPGNYTVTVVDKNQCSETISVNMPDTASIFTIEGVVNSEQCVDDQNKNSSISLFISSNVISPYIINWEKWEKIENSNSQQVDNSNNEVYGWVPIAGSQGKLNLTGLGHGEYRVEVQDSNTSGCNEVSKIFSIEKSNLIVSNTSITNPTCDNEKGKFSFKVESSNSVKYFLNGTEISTNNSPSNPFDFDIIDNVHVISNLSAGNYLLKIVDQIPFEDTFKLGCEKFIDFNIEAYDQITYSGNTNVILDVCENTETFPSPLLVSGGDPFVDKDGNQTYIYSWKGPDNFQALTTSPINVVEGTYELVIQDASGCVSSPYIFNFSYNETPISITESIIPLGCGESNNEGSISINILGGKAPYKITWEKEIVDSSNNPSPAYETIGTNLLAVNNLSEGRYRLTVESSTEFCSNTSLTSVTKFYTLLPQESIEIISGPFLSKSLCIGDSGTIQIKLFDKSFSELSFYYNNQLVSGNFLGDDTYEIAIDEPIEESSLFISNQFGCGVSLPIITGVGNPDFSYTSNSLEQTGLISANEKVTFSNTSSDSYIRMEWDFGDGSSILEITPENEATTEIVHTYGNPGSFSVKLRFYNILGCYKEVEQEIRIGKGYLVIFPSAFTPNRDGINDIFEPKYTGIKSFNLEIFDMWGNLIFSNQINNLPVQANWGWDGSYKTNKIYPYKNFRYRFTAITHDDQQISYNGEATILR